MATFSDDFIKALYKEKPLPLSYREGMTESERAVWISALKENITKKMAFSEETYPEPKVRFLMRKDRGAYFVEKYEISPEPDLFMRFLLLVPKTASETNKTPAVLCTPGTGWRKECLAAEEFFDLEYNPAQPPEGLAHRYYYANAMAQHYALSGMTALACEDIASGEHLGNIPPNHIGHYLVAQGRSMMGVTVSVRLAMLKFLKGLPYVDKERLAVSGHSLGVDSLMHVALLDDDVKAFVYNDFACDWQDRIRNTAAPMNCWHVYPGMHRDYTYIDLLAAFAPRKLFITEGGKTQYLLRIQNAYRELGAQANFRYDYYPDYQNPDNRKHEDEAIYEGMSHETYFEFCNVVPEKHFFKFETAVPWLTETLNHL